MLFLCDFKSQKKRKIQKLPKLFLPGFHRKHAFLLATFSSPQRFAPRPSLNPSPRTPFLGGVGTPRNAPHPLLPPGTTGLPSPWACRRLSPAHRQAHDVRSPPAVNTIPPSTLEPGLSGSLLRPLARLLLSRPPRDSVQTCWAGGP